MKAVVLAAGEGQRLRPLTDNTPKVMLPVANLPILNYIVEAIVEAGIREITIVVGYHSEKIRRHFGNGGGFGASIDYVVQEKQLGTAHALYQARGDYESIVLPGDNIISSDCVRMISKSNKNTILATHSGNSSKYGVVEHSGNKVVKITEKPVGEREELVFTGLGHYGPEIFGHIEEGLNEGIYDMTHVLNRVSGLEVLVSDCLWKDAVYPWDLLELNEWAMKSITRELSGKIEESIVIGNVSIGKGTVISGGCYIKGPVIIGKNCRIGPGAVILGNTAICNDVSIGGLSFIKNSIIMSSTSIKHRASIEDSIIGMGNEINNGVEMLRSRWEKVVDGEILSGDSGVVIGGDCRIGALSVIHAGVKIASETRVRAQSTIREDIAREEVV